MTTTKHDYSNFGLLEKQARRYSTLWTRYCKRWDNGTVETDPKQESESDEMGKIRHQIYGLVGYDLRHDIINSLEDGFDFLFTDWKDYQSNFEYLLGIVTGIGIKKMKVGVRNENEDELNFLANKHGWKTRETPYKSKVLGTSLVTLVNTRQTKD